MSEGRTVRRPVRVEAEVAKGANFPPRRHRSANIAFMEKGGIPRGTGITNAPKEMWPMKLGDADKGWKDLGD